MSQRSRHEYEVIGGDDEDDVSLVSLNNNNNNSNQSPVVATNSQLLATTTSDSKQDRRYSVSFAEIVHRKENPKKFEKTIPRDAYSMARIMFLLMGSGILVPGICFQLSVDWFTLIFPTPSPDSFNLFDFLEYILSFGFNIGQLTSMIIYTIFMWRKSVHTLKAQTFTVEQFIFLGYALNFVCVLVTLFINVILVNQYGFNNNEQTYDKIFMLACVICLNCLVGIGSGILSAAVISFAANFTWKYTVFFLVGLSLGNALLSVFRIISRSIWLDTSSGLFNSIILFFSFSAIVQVICIGAFIYLLRLPITRYCKENYVNMQTPMRDLDEQIRVSRLEKDMLNEKLKEDTDNFSTTTSGSGSGGVGVGGNEESIGTIGNLNGDSIVGAAADDNDDFLDSQSLMTEKPEIPDISVNMNDFGITWLSLMRKLWSPGLGIFVTFLTTFSLTPGLITDIRFINEGKDIYMSWNPIITLSIFNVFDCIGRALPNWKRTILLTHKQLWILILLRLGFVPVIIFCVNPLYITQTIWFSIILALFGLTNGYCCSIGMASGPSVVKTGEQEKAAYLMNFFLNTGLLFGSAVGIGCGYLVHFAW